MAVFKNRLFYPLKTVLFNLQLRQVFLFSLIAVFFFTASGWCNLTTSVNKYKNSDMTDEQIRKLARYDHLIRYFSNFAYFVPKHKVNPDFIRALIVAESDVNPRAISTMKALGWGQILLSTGRPAGKELSRICVFV